MMSTDKNRPADFSPEKGRDFSHIKGWGIDADPRNDPTYPMRQRPEGESRGYTWERPPQQSVSIEILKSVERPNLPAVFGSTIPPSGLSGMIRRAAFRKGESTYSRWIPLVLADRINVYEGMLNDLAHGIFPNTFSERGWQAEWKHNRKSFLIKSAALLAVTAGIATAVGILGRRKGVKSYEL